jgi:hypothetical protein
VILTLVSKPFDWKLTLDALFADYYFQALKTQNLPKPWDDLQKKETTAASNLFLLLRGANIHINHDLPLALNTFKDPESLRHDFFHVKQIFKKSILEILLAFDPKSKQPGIRRSIIFRSILFLVLHWRKVAWKNAMRLKKGSFLNKDLLTRTCSISRIISFFESLAR